MSIPMYGILIIASVVLLLGGILAVITLIGEHKYKKLTELSLFWKELDTIYNKWRKTEDKYEKLAQLITLIEQREEEKDATGQDAHTLTKQFESLMPDQCPLCGK